MRIDKTNITLFYLFISYILFLLPLILIGSGLERIESYLLALFSASISIVYLSYKFRNLFKTNIAILAMTGFYIKILIGYMFWEFYMWPDYFNQFSNIYFDHYEYLSTHTSMVQIAEHRIDFGFFTLPPVDYAKGQGKYIYINYIMSNLYMSGNYNLLDFSVQSSLFSFYTAVIIALIAMTFGVTKKQLKIIFIIALFQPFSFISTMIWRDVVGQFFAMLSIYLLLISFKNSRMTKVLITLTLSSLSFFLLRSIYVIIPIFIYLIKYLRDGLITVRKASILIALITVVILVLYSTNLINFLVTGYSSYLDNVLSINFILSLPIGYIKALIGPFPWINWFQFTDNTIFLIANYLQAVYVLVVIYFTIKYYKSSESDFKSYIVFIFFILLSMSLVTRDIHSEYFTFAAALLLPISAKYLTIKRFILIYCVVFLGFVLFNVIYISWTA